MLMRLLFCIAGAFCCALGGPLAWSETCDHYSADKQVFWGDLHVHTSYSLDAWGYGTKVTPDQAYAFARGEVLNSDRQVRLAEPLDFMAVTDHAEWFNLMYLCTDPVKSAHAYCNVLTEKNSRATGGEVFAEYVLPTITKAQPQPTVLCQEQPENCRSAHLSQWARVQQHANDANEPCRFTSFVAYEWSATPDYSHNHRNVIFANEQVPPDAFDYMRFPTPEHLWRQLDEHCQAVDGCEAIAIPHNTNMGDGKSFDIETETPDVLALRAHYERLVEVHQEKGNSECLPATPGTDEDCGYELYLTRNSRVTPVDEYTSVEWTRMRGSYVRQLLLRGLRGYQASNGQLNPLQLGLIGSTDNHSATGGFVDEQSWPGTVFGQGDFERSMTRVNWNPGGLVGVWAEENTRASIFAALKRREVFATSGPRMRVRLEAATQPLACDGAREGVPMGGSIHKGTVMHFRLQAQASDTPLERIELVKGTLEAGQLVESVQTVWHNAEGAFDICRVVAEPDVNARAPAFWYMRVHQVPTPRWSAYHCQRAGRCADYPEAERWIRERAWSSPIWYLPEVFDG